MPQATAETIFVGVMALVLLSAFILVISFRIRQRKKREAGFGFVYVNQDGSVRELSPNERAYLSEEFSGGDGGRPYIKTRYTSSDGWGSQSGFMARRKVPRHVSIRPVHADYDVLEQELGMDLFGSHRAVGDIVEKQADGSILITPNPLMSHKDRFENLRQQQLAEQRRREELAKK